MFWFVGISWQQFLIGIAVRLLIIFAVLPIHEYAHARMAYKLGDDTAKQMGRLTLNPLAHIDWIGAGLILLFGFGWAKPVPVNPYRFDNQSKRKQGMALTALAGPLSNLAVALISVFILRIVACFYMPYGAAVLVNFALTWLFTINITLAVFNLIPIHPLDGSRILGGILPNSWNDFINKNSQIVTIIAMVAIFAGVLDPVINFFSNGLSDAMLFVADGLFDLVGLHESPMWSGIF